MLSGIGPRAELERHGIDVRVDLAGVGAHLQDRIEVSVVNEFDQPFRALDNACGFQPPTSQDDADPCLAQWRRGRGIYTSNGAVLSVVARSRPDLERPDLFIFGLPAMFTGYRRGYSADLLGHRKTFSWVILKAHTKNRAGTVKLASADPIDRPDINFHHFDEGTDTAGEDLDAVVAGIRLARGIVARTGRASREVTPGAALTTDDQLREFVRQRAWGHHASGTCAIGKPTDLDAVVDSAFRVIGTRNLRVVDASVFPRIPGYFLVTPIYVISEKASDVVLADAGVTRPRASGFRRWP
jgi:choline dehydrogenase